LLCVAALGFVRMMLAAGVGAEVQRPLATVIDFVMACDTFLTMLALPVLYLRFGKGPRLEAENGQESPEQTTVKAPIKH
jgi:heavy metal efflux system protein